MNNVNPSALLRSLIMYGVCVPLAIVVGYLLSDPWQAQSLGIVSAMVTILIFPLLMKWHYPLLIFSWTLPASLFFIPGHPTPFLIMVVASLSISFVERILDRNQSFLPSGGVRWPLLAFLVVVFITAQLTGGFGLRSMGSNVYGGKKYVFLIIGILSFFAITARAIPKKRANFYVTLYFAGSFFCVLQDLYYFTPSPLRFIFLVFPSTGALDSMGNTEVVLGKTRMLGVATAAGAVFCWMLARHGFRENFLTAKLWRPLLLASMFILAFLGGFRSTIVVLLALSAIVFFLEKLHRTGAMLVVVMVAILGAVLVVPLAPSLPFTFQRALAFLPGLDISSDAKISAEGSTQWRLDMWAALLPQVPKYLFLGKGYAFSAETFNESMGRDAMFHKSIDASDDPLALSSDFHSGPLSVVLSFGIWGCIVWLWYWAAGFFVVWRNYHYGDSELRHINRFLFAMFVAKCFSFLFIFGAVVDDVGGFAGIIGLSIAINHGVMSRKQAPTMAQTSPARLQSGPLYPRLCSPGPVFRR